MKILLAGGMVVEFLSLKKQDKMYKKRILIVTGATEIFPEKGDTGIMSVLDASMVSKQKYAQKHNYDLICMRSFGSDISGRYKDTDIGFLRVLRVFDFLEYYDIVMWIDADAIITNDSYKIEDFELTDQHVFYASPDWNNNNTFNTGNFIIKKTENLKYFKETFLAASKNFQNEQDTINFLFYNTQLKLLMKMIHHRYLNSALDNKLAIPLLEPSDQVGWSRNRPNVVNPWNKDYFLIHLTGMSNVNRINIMNKIFQEYL
jgi:lipopolysaccharide biosynthesis glycosyltransferase